MEVLVIGEMKFEALLPAFTASIAASATSQALGLGKIYFYIIRTHLFLLGIACTTSPVGSYFWHSWRTVCMVF